MVSAIKSKELATHQHWLAKVGNKSCSRSDACFVCNMNYCCDHDVFSSKSHVSRCVANFLFSYFFTVEINPYSSFLNSKFFVLLIYLLFTKCLERAGTSSIFYSLKNWLGDSPQLLSPRMVRGKTLHIT